jgi:hypothetical protein
MLWVDEEDDPASSDRVGLAGVLVGDPVDDVPGLVAGDLLGDPAADAR